MKNQSSLELKLAGDLPGGQSGLVALWCSLLLLSVLIYQCPYFIAVVAPGCHIWRLLRTFITPRVSQPEGWCLCLISKKKHPLPHQTPTPSQFEPTIDAVIAGEFSVGGGDVFNNFLLFPLCSFPVGFGPNR